MGPPRRPSSASAGRRHAPPEEARRTAAGATSVSSARATYGEGSAGPKETGPGPAPGARVGTRQRPLSAQPGRPPATPARGPSPPPGRGGHITRGAPRLASEKIQKALREQNEELKRQANSCVNENKKNATRTSALERDNLKRGKLVATMRKLQTPTPQHPAGQGFSIDVIHKLRDERNMIPILRGKSADLQAQIEKADSDISAMKHEERFTRIIELQIEYASWTHETKRLQSLLKSKAASRDGELDPVARQEAEVQERRLEQLKRQLGTLQEKRDSLLSDIPQLKVEKEEAEQDEKESEEELKEQQRLTREAAMRFKELLADKKRAEQTEDEVRTMTEERDHLDQVLEQAARVPPATAPAAGRDEVSESLLKQGKAGAPEALRESLWALRRAAAARHGEEALFEVFRAKDADQDGLLSGGELREALEGFVPAPSEVAAGLQEWLADKAASGGGPPAVCWLDVLVALDRLGTLAPRPQQPTTAMPEASTLRPACLRLGITSEELRRRLLGVRQGRAAQELFRGLGLGEGLVGRWAQAWEALGSARLLLQMDLGEAAPCEDAHRAWWARCCHAVSSHREVLSDAFDMGRQLTLPDFRMVALDMLGQELSEDDIEDLGLMAVSAGGEVDLAFVLRLEPRTN